MLFLKKYRFVLILFSVLISGGLLSFVSKNNDEISIQIKEYKTEYVIILVIDGPRMTETFGDTSYQYIPNLAGVLAPQGVLLPNFKNNGKTQTNAGHTAITTGVNQSIKNNGLELPKNPSMFQYFLKERELPSNQAWVISSKGKLSILANTKNKKWKDQFVPSQYCGLDGTGMGYANDKPTWKQAKSILKEHHPKLSLINLLEVDVCGHQNQWPEYIQGIRNTDAIALELWDIIQSDSIYKNKTTLFITNDHGRHLDGHKEGFINHGDNCAGCRSIYLLALGPDFKSNTVMANEYELIDISKTIAELLHFDFPVSKGKIMTDLFK